MPTPAADPEQLSLKYVRLAVLQRAPRNPKDHDAPGIRASIDRHGFVEPSLIDERTGRLVGGHGRLDDLEARKAAGEPPPGRVLLDTDGEWLMPVVHGYRSANDAEAEALLVGMNRLPEAGGWEPQGLYTILDELRSSDLGLAGTGYSTESMDALLDSLGAGQPETAEPQPSGPDAASLGTLAARFLVPPFSVLDARQGYWQDRKRAWLALGIRSEEGRAHNLLAMSDSVLEAQRPSSPPNRPVPNSHSGNDPAYGWKKQEAERVADRKLSNAEFEADYYEADAYVGGTSIFDPVLCEVAYRWFCPPGGHVLDPFAGGSVRGVVAGWLGLDYTGIDLRTEQTAANADQWAAIRGSHPGAPEPGTVSWLTGEAAATLAAPDAAIMPADLVFSCPPYYDLERYSDDPADLSAAATYDEFLVGYEAVIRQALARLSPDRFAVFVVGDIRGDDGSYRGLVPDTIRLFSEAGAAHHNDAILVTAIGSLALRAAKIFGGARRLAKAHQNVLVFVKGDPRAAVEACGQLSVPDPAELFGVVQS